MSKSRVTREEWLARIGASIKRCGCWIYWVMGGPSPRFVYTIGVSEASGAELILAGASIFQDKHEIKRIVEAFAGRGAALTAETTVDLDALGRFSLREVDLSWTTELLLGALDYYQRRGVAALQIVPDQDHWTVDIPDLTRPRNEDAEPLWQWLTRPWPYSIAKSARAVTNLDALRGARVTEAARWEEEEWQLYAGARPNVAEQAVRVVPLGTLLAVDPTLIPVMDLKIGAGLWRDSAELDWHPWAVSTQDEGEDENEPVPEED